MLSSVIVLHHACPPSHVPWAPHPPMPARRLPSAMRRAMSAGLSRVVPHASSRGDAPTACTPNAPPSPPLPPPEGDDGCCCGCARPLAAARSMSLNASMSYAGSGAGGRVTAARAAASSSEASPPGGCRWCGVGVIWGAGYVWSHWWCVEGVAAWADGVGLWVVCGGVA